MEWRKSTEQRIRKWIEKNDSPFRRLQELSQSGTANDDDFDMLFNFLRKDLDLSLVMNENDSTLKLLEFFDCFHTRLTLTNQFYYYDVLAQIHNNMGNIIRAKELLTNALAIDVQIPKKVFNSGLLAYLNHEFEKVKQIAVDLIDKPEYYYLLLVLGVNDLNELISLDTQISNGGIEDINVQINMAVKAIDYKEVHLCRKYTKLALGHNPQMPSLLFVSIKNLMFSISEDRHIDWGYPDTQAVDDVQSVVQLCDQLLGSRVLDENRTQWLLYYKAYSLFLLHDLNDALFTANQVGSSDLEFDLQLLRVRVYNALEQYNVSIQILEKVIEEGIENPSIPYLYASSLLRMHDYQGFANYINTIYGDIHNVPNVQFARLVSQYLNISSGREVSEAYLNDMCEKSVDIELLIENLYLNYLSLDPNLIQQYYLNKLKGKMDHLTNIAVSRLAMFMFDHDLFDIAIELFERVFHIELNQIMVKAYLSSLLSVGNNIKALDVSSQIRSTKNDMDFTNYETSALESLGKISEATSLSKEFFEIKRDLPSACMYSHFLLLEGNTNEAGTILDAFRDAQIDDSRVFYNYSHLLARISNYQILLDVMYRYIRVNKGNENAVQYFISVFLSFSRKSEFLEFIKEYDEEIKDDSGAVVSTETGNKIIYLYNSSGADSSFYEFNAGSNWWKQLYGKHKGDQILVRRMGIEKTYRVTDIQHRVVIKFNELIEHVSEYGQQNFLTKVTIDLSKDPLKEIDSKFGDSLKQNHDRIEYVENLYRDNPIPLSFIADILGKEIVATYLRFFHSNDVRFWASSGNFDDFMASYQLLEKSKSLIIDYTGALFIGKHELWNAVSSCFSLVCSRKTVETFESYIEKELTTLLEVEGFMSYKDGKPVFMPNLKAGIQESINWYKQLVQDITKYATVIGDTESFNFYEVKKQYHLDDLQQDYLKTLDSDSLAIAIHNMLPLYSDDFGFRLIGTEYGVNCTWSQVLIDILLNRGIINKDRYFEMIRELLSLRYQFIHINSGMIIEVIERNEYKHTPEVDLYLDGIIDCRFDSIQSIFTEVVAAQQTPRHIEDVMYMFLNKLWAKFKNTTVIELIRTHFNHNFTGPGLIEVNKVFNKWLVIINKL
ncbi:MAG: hypothetical protein CVU49_03915 [Candidatus Cloacimonetes bacterium HGW-Cloacimonetes-2]|nr:MAG: hypothetical protein CVU49_03915 [Candidatus Cloacimonetes bacterium HGW-Cloacimonetes-2]